MEFFFSILIVVVLSLLVVPLILSIVAITQSSQFRSTIRRYEDVNRQLQLRLIELELLLRREAPPAPPPVPVTQPATEPPQIPSFIRPIEPAPALATGESGEAESLEDKIGKSWTVWSGVIIIFLALGFFLKYAIDSGIFAPTARVVMVMLYGLLMLMTGDRMLRRNWRALGEGLMGGGLAIIYLALYSAFAIYHLAWFPAPAALASLLLLTGLGMALAILDNALSLAFLAVLGGFLTPVMMTTGGGARDILMTYLLVLDFGVIGVAFYRNWRAFDVLAFAGTWLLYLNWFVNYYAKAVLPESIWISAFYLVFLIVPFIYHLRNRVQVPVERFLLAMLNAAIAFSFFYAILAPQYQITLAFIALGLSATTLIMGSLTRERLPGDATTLFGFITLSVTFLTLAIPLGLKAHGIALLWAAEGPVLLYLGYRFRYFPVRVGGFIVLALAVVRLFAVHWPLHEGWFTPFFNVNFLSAVSVPAAIAAYAYIHYAWRHEGNETDDTLKIVSGIGAGLLGLFLVQTELGLWLSTAQQALAAGFALAAIWAAGGLLFVMVGLRVRRLAVQAAGVFPLTVALILTIMLYGSEVKYLLFLNPRFGAAAFTALCGYLAWWLSYRRQAQRDLQQVLFALFEVALFLQLSVEAFINTPRGIEDYEQARWVAQMALTITWGAYAGGLLAVGFRRLSRGMRITALAIFGATVLKLFFIDLAVLDFVYRILAFFIIGLLMLGASYLYHRVEKHLATLEGERS